MINTEYITFPGDRWDLIAYKAYGTIGMITTDDGDVVNAISLIVNANPDIPVDSILSSGLLVQVPIVSDTTSKSDPSLLPPWK